MAVSGQHSALDILGRGEFPATHGMDRRLAGLPM